MHRYADSNWSNWLDGIYLVVFNVLLITLDDGLKCSKLLSD